MRILVLTQDFPPIPGGIAVFLHHLCLELCQRGHQVNVLTCAQDSAGAFDDCQDYGVFRYRVLGRFSSVPPFAATLRRQWQDHYDLVFLGHFMTTHALGALVLRWLRGVPYAILSHGNDLALGVSTRVDAWAARLLLRNAALMLANSRFTASRIREAGYRGRIEVLNPGVDPTQFYPGVDAAEVRREFGLDGRQVLLTVGRLVARKNVHGVLYALPQVIEQVPDVVYMVVGDGEERPRLEWMCKELGLSSHVRFLKYVEDSQLPALYCVSDIFVMPSCSRDGGRDYEGFGIVFVEANACGKPVIGGRGGGMNDAVIDGETGLLVNPESSDEIAAAIVRLLRDKELARRLGANGRRRAVEELSWSKVAERLEGMLTPLVEVELVGR